MSSSCMTYTLQVGCFSSLSCSGQVSYSYGTVESSNSLFYRKSLTGSTSITGGYVFIHSPSGGMINLSEIKVYLGTTQLSNLRLQLSSTYVSFSYNNAYGSYSSYCTDNILASVCHTNDLHPWIMIDMNGREYDRIEIINRNDCCQDRITSATILISKDFAGNQASNWGYLESTAKVSYTILFPVQPTIYGTGLISDPSRGNYLVGGYGSGSTSSNSDSWTSADNSMSVAVSPNNYFYGFDQPQSLTLVLQYGQVANELIGLALFSSLTPSSSPVRRSTATVSSISQSFISGIASNAFGVAVSSIVNGETISPRDLISPSSVIGTGIDLGLEAFCPECVAAYTVTDTVITAFTGRSIPDQIASFFGWRRRLSATDDSIFYMVNLTIAISNPNLTPEQLELISNYLKSRLSNSTSSGQLTYAMGTFGAYMNGSHTMVANLTDIVHTPGYVSRSVLTSTLLDQGRPIYSGSLSPEFFAQSSPVPSSKPSPKPTLQPSPEPSFLPSPIPSSKPTPQPSLQLIAVPTQSLSIQFRSNLTLSSQGNTLSEVDQFIIRQTYAVVTMMSIDAIIFDGYISTRESNTTRKLIRDDWKPLTTSRYSYSITSFLRIQWVVASLNGETESLKQFNQIRGSLMNASTSGSLSNALINSIAKYQNSSSTLLNASILQLTSDSVPKIMGPMSFQSPSPSTAPVSMMNDPNSKKNSNLISNTYIGLIVGGVVGFILFGFFFKRFSASYSEKKTTDKFSSAI